MSIDDKFQLAEVDVCGVSDVNGFVDCYEKFGRDVDPVMSYVLDRHAPAHEELVLPSGGWKQCELYRRCCAYYGHEHIMNRATNPCFINGLIRVLCNRQLSTVNYQ
jgi:hypothetical protein